MEVNFKARTLFAKDVNTIKKLPEAGAKLSLIELKAARANDYDTVKRISSIWFKESDFIKFIADEMKYTHYRESDAEFPYTRFFALTKQERDFKVANPYDILSIAQITTENDRIRNLDFVEANPMLSTNLPYSGLKDTTAKLIEYVMELFKFKTITVHALKSEVDMYKNVGFKDTGISNCGDRIRILEKKPNGSPEI